MTTNENPTTPFAAIRVGDILHLESGDHAVTAVTTTDDRVTVEWGTHNMSLPLSAARAFEFNVTPSRPTPARLMPYTVECIELVWTIFTGTDLIDADESMDELHICRDDDGTSDYSAAWRTTPEQMINGWMLSTLIDLLGRRPIRDI